MDLETRAGTFTNHSSNGHHCPVMPIRNGNTGNTKTICHKLYTIHSLIIERNDVYRIAYRMWAQNTSSSSYVARQYSRRKTCSDVHWKWAFLLLQNTFSLPSLSPTDVGVLHPRVGFFYFSVSETARNNLRSIMGKMLWAKYDAFFSLCSCNTVILCCLKVQ